MPELGPTGKFPEGKINKDDQGEIKLKVGTIVDPNTKETKVMVDFGRQVARFAMTANQAMEFAKTIRKKAKKVIRGRSYQ